MNCRTTLIIKNKVIVECTVTGDYMEDENEVGLNALIEALPKINQTISERAANLKIFINNNPKADRVGNEKLKEEFKGICGNWENYSGNDPSRRIARKVISIIYEEMFDENITFKDSKAM